MSSTHLRTKSCFVALVLALLLAQSGPAFSQKAYFVDGYHGGVYGHYPPWVTGFLVEKLRQNPDWRICLEIEPVTWDTVRADTPEAYKEFKAMATDPATRDRIEFVNPAYGQSYCYNIPGEMLIRQFTVGQRKLREHFPDFKPLTYCSEEPCFTSALPGILRSLGFKYAVLKNPGTCFGGYTRAFGGELVNWMGPDGTTIPTVPRYESEGLARDNTWQTMAWRNVPPYIHAALKQGIAHPVGMCLQDAGWRQGPFLTDFYGVYKPTQYVTWREYFENVAVKTPDRDWRMSQEDVQVTLVWGAQVLQRIAQQCRRAENTILSTEKLAAMAKLVAAAPWPEASFNKAWPTLLLAQHHDCWIVPNNARRGDSWADKVGRWTGSTREICANVAKQSLAALAPSGTSGDAWRIRVFNTLGVQRRELVEIPLPAEIAATPLAVRDGDGREVPSQIVASRKEGASPALLLCASVPPLGYSTYRLDRAAPAAVSGARATLGPDDVCTLETDRYSVVLNGRCGGTIRSLMSKLPQPRQWVDASSPRKFGEIRGFFRDERAFRGNAEQPARFEILENGPMRVRVLVRGRIGEHPIAQEITLVQGQDRVDFNLELAWQGNPSIGEEYARKSGPRREDRHKAFYDDRYKLQVLFPSTLKSPKIFKNAPLRCHRKPLAQHFLQHLGRYQEQRHSELGGCARRRRGSRPWTVDRPHYLLRARAGLSLGPDAAIFRRGNLAGISHRRGQSGPLRTAAALGQLAADATLDRQRSVE